MVDNSNGLKERIEKRLAEPEGVYSGSYKSAVFKTCVHSTILGMGKEFPDGGPRFAYEKGFSLGGCRPDGRSVDEAERISIELATGMTFKWGGFNMLCDYEAQNREGGKWLLDPAFAQYGGAKTVIFDPERFLDNSDERGNLFRAFGTFLNTIQPPTVTAPDYSTNSNDMGFVGEETDFVCCKEDQTGTPATVTALGVYFGLKGLHEARYGTESLYGKLFLKGVGAVGKILFDLLDTREPNLEIVVTDLQREMAAELVADSRHHVVSPNDLNALRDEHVRFFVPCAKKYSLSRSVAKIMHPRIMVAGAENDMFQTGDDGTINDAAQLFHDKGIYVATDYTLNSGGIASVAFASDRAGAERMMKEMAGFQRDLYFLAQNSPKERPDQMAHHLVLNILADHIRQKGLERKLFH